MNGSIAESWRNVHSLEWVQPLAAGWEGAPNLDQGQGLVDQSAGHAVPALCPGAAPRRSGLLRGAWRSPAVTSIPCTTVSCERSHGWGAAHRSISTANLWPRVSARAEGRCARRWWFRELGLGLGSGGGLGHGRLSEGWPETGRGSWTQLGEWRLPDVMGKGLCGEKRVEQVPGPGGSSVAREE